MTVALLPAAPLITDGATTFPGIANAFFASLVTMVSEVNTLSATFVVLPTPLSTLPALPGSTSFVTGADAFVAGLPGLVSDVNGMIAELSLAVADVTTLPATPSRTSDPGNFTTEGPAFLVAMTTLQAELNAFIAALNAYDPSTPAGGDLQTVVGNGNWVAQALFGNSGNGQLVKITTPAGPNCDLPSIFAAFSGFTAGVSVKALLVADSGGSPANGTTLAVGTAVTPGSSVVTQIVEMPFASAPTLNPSTSYWVGFVPSASVAPILADANFSNTVGMQVGVSYASPSWDASTDTTSGRLAIWAPLSQAGIATGTHQQGSTPLFKSNAAMRMMLPPHSIGDVIILDMGQWFGTLPTISGFTELSNQSFSGMNHRILARTIDGTEDGTIAIPAPSSNDRTAVATVFRGGGAIEGTAHNSGSGTTVTTAAVTTLGANRRVFNFVAFGQGSGGANTESSDGWTDVYSLVDGNYSHSLSYKDQASAGSSGTEARTTPSTFWHTTSWAKSDV